MAEQLRNLGPQVNVLRTATQPMTSSVEDKVIQAIEHRQRSLTDQLSINAGYMGEKYTFEGPAASQFGQAGSWRTKVFFLTAVVGSETLQYDLAVLALSWGSRSLLCGRRPKNGPEFPVIGNAIEADDALIFTRLSILSLWKPEELREALQGFRSACRRPIGGGKSGAEGGWPVDCQLFRHRHRAGLAGR